MTIARHTVPTASSDSADKAPARAGRLTAGGRSRLARILVAGTIAGASALALAAPAGATPPTPTYAGAATLFNTTTSAADAGGSADNFTINLPAGAACPGDTTSGGYLIDSYFVPQTTDVTTLNFSGGFPSTGYALYNSTNNHQFEAANTNSGTGQIAGIPQTLQFGAQVTRNHPTKATLLAGTGVWEVGIACDLNGALSSYWNTQVTFTPSTTDAGGFTWTDAPGAPTAPPQTPEVPVALGLPLAAAVIVGGYVLIRRRRVQGAHASTPAG
jgi:hypothetical protein